MPTLSGIKQLERYKVEKVTICNVTVKIYKRQRATTSAQFRTVYKRVDYSGGTRRSAAAPITPSRQRRLGSRVSTILAPVRKRGGVK